MLLVEAACLPGRGTLHVTGTVGPMTRESANALSVPSPRPAGRRGSRGPEPVDNAVGRAAAGLAVGLAATGGRVDGRGDTRRRSG